MPVLLVMAGDYLLRWWLVARSGEARVERVEVIPLSSGGASSGGDIVMLEISHPRIKVRPSGLGATAVRF